MYYIFSRPEKEGFDLMRAALPHLRLLNLSRMQLSLLSKYLLAEEMTFLAVQKVFKDQIVVAPPTSVNTNHTPRVKVASQQSLQCQSDIIPDDLIITDHFKMGGRPLNKIRAKSGQREIFSFDLTKIHQDMCLTGIEILTQANNCPEFKHAEGKNPKGYLF